MNALLSLFLSIAMLISGGTLPATVETASTLVIRDFCLDYNGESYPIDFEIALTGAAAENELALHFEIRDGEDVILPLSGRADESGVMFTVSENGNAYSFSAEDITEIMNLGEGAVAEFEDMTGMIRRNAELTRLSQNLRGASPETEAAVLDAFFGAMQNRDSYSAYHEFSCGVMDARYLQGQMSPLNMLQGLDALLNMDNEDVASLMAAMLDMYNEILAMGGEITVNTGAASVGVIGGADGPTAVYVAGEEFAPAESFSQLFTALAGDEAAELEAPMMNVALITAEDEEKRCMQIVLTPWQAAEDFELRAEEITTAEGSDAWVTMTAADGEGQVTGIETTVRIDGPETAPEHVSMNMTFFNESRQEITVPDAPDAAGNYTLYTQSAVIAGEADFHNGLQDVSFTLNFGDHTALYLSDALSEEESTNALAMDVQMKQEMSGEAVLSDYELSAETGDGESYGLRFTAELSEAPAADYFAGREVIALSADTEAPAYNKLGLDALYLMSDAAAIAAREDFMKLSGLFNSDDQLYIETEEIEPFPESPEWEYDSLEAAADTFTGEIPAYTPPEGYALEQVIVSTLTDEGDYLEADYASENGDSFCLALCDYDTDPALSCTFEDGMLTAIEQPLYNLHGENGLYYSAGTYNGRTSVSFFFDRDMTIEEIQPILAGLE